VGGMDDATALAELGKLESRSQSKGESSLLSDVCLASFVSLLPVRFFPSWRSADVLQGATACPLPAASPPPPPIA
jgi:hypothetical protein